MPTPTATTTPPLPSVNFLSPAVAVPTAHKPVFEGAQREKVKTLLATKIVERQVISVLQLVNKDPSLALESVPLNVMAGGVGRLENIDFAFACLEHGVMPGYIFAVNAGYDIDKPNAAGFSLLEVAASKIQHGSEKDLGVLLSMGANPNGLPGGDRSYPGVFATAMQQAYPLAMGAAQHPGVISILLDAKANPTYSSSIKCPLTILVCADGWNDAARVAEMTKMMVRLVKGGCSPDARSGSPSLTPLERVIGQHKGAALVSLIQVGADTSAGALKGKDLFDLMASNKMNGYLPDVQSALMEMKIAKIKAAANLSMGQGQAQVEAEPCESARPRRRMGSI